MSDPMVMIEEFDAGEPRIQIVRAAIIAGSADSVQAGTTAMERLFNEHTAVNASEYVYRHPDDERFVPRPLPEPALVNMTVSGFTDAEFDGTRWFGETKAE